MGQFGNKLRRYSTYGGTERGFAHWCPACGETHQFTTERNTPGERPMWTFDGNAEAPTFSRSMKITGKQTVKDAEGEWTGEWVRGPDGKPIDYCCHYILTAGVLNYCGDSTHAMSGQAIPLPDLPPHLKDEALT